ncbi:hypothetical protein H6G90_20905 [Nostoc sp. FACHB-145]|nr:hypothetical protein [Nostoc sp. FACHB-145]
MAPKNYAQAYENFVFSRLNYSKTRKIAGSYDFYKDARLHTGIVSGF